jgi:hypothetical protein
MSCFERVADLARRATTCEASEELLVHDRRRLRQSSQIDGEIRQQAAILALRHGDHLPASKSLRSCAFGGSPPWSFPFFGMTSGQHLQAERE